MHLIIFVWITVSVAAFEGVQEVKANGFSSDLPPCSEAAAPLCPVANSGNVVASQYWQWHWGVTHGTPYSLTADGASSPETSRNSMVHEPLSSSEKINADAILDYPIHTDYKL